MTEDIDQLAKQLQTFIVDLDKDLLLPDPGPFIQRVSDLEQRMARLEASLAKLKTSPSTKTPPKLRQIKRITLKDRLVRLVKSRPDGITAFEAANRTNVPLENVTSALKQAARENLIIIDGRERYQAIE